MAEEYVPDEEQDKTPEEQLRDVETGNIPERNITVMIVKMIQDLGKRIDTQVKKIQEMFNKDLEELKNRDEQHNNRNEKYTKRNQ